MTRWLGETVRRRITVTEVDISKGKRDDCDKCPVARAVQRHVDKYWEVTVYPESVLITHYDWRVSLGLKMDLPEKAKAFISRFDTRGPEAVKPTWFWMMLPAPCARAREFGVRAS